MPAPIGFDVYGTMIEVGRMVEQLRPLVGERAEDFQKLWRRTQLEFAIRRAAMRRYEDFTVCARQALEYADRTFKTGLSGSDKNQLIESQSRLPAFPDASPGLDALRAAGHPLFAFSNGTLQALEKGLHHAGLREHLDGVVSVDEVGTFKPVPEAYAHFVARTGRDAAEVWLVSSNPWDVLGAKSAGLRAAWVHRSPDEVFDPWDLEPDLVAADFRDLADRLAASRGD